jgi:diketogulonate reductase-like aldo/keto reductase
MSVKLSDGNSMPSIAFGFWQIPGEQCAAALEAAIDAGYRCLDFAAIYGNEEECGEALAKVFASGKVKREDLYIVTKLWATDWHQVDAACSLSLQKLKLDYVDLYLVHSSVGVDVSAGLDEKRRKIRHKIPFHVLWKDMEGLVKSGKTKSIGVSNWSCLQVADALNYATIPPAVNQLEIHPTFSSADLAQWCLSAGVAVMAYCPLGSGKPDMTLEPVTKAASRLGVSPAQVLIKWSLQKGYVPVTKSVNPDRMKSNRALDFALSEEEVEALDACEGGMDMKICDHAGEFGLPVYN